MRYKLAQVLAAACALLAFCLPAGASDVAVFGERYPLSIINNFYNSLPGVTSTNLGSVQLDTVDLTDVRLLWAVQPADSYTPSEISTMANFLAGGGRIAFMGEHGTFAPAENARISAALVQLGSTISIIPGAIVDPGFRSASVADGQILPHPLTAGVNTYEYAAFDPLAVSGTAQVLMVGEDDPSAIMMAYQNIGPGSIFLITDQNVWDNSTSGWPGFDNEVMFANLLQAATGAPPPPGASAPEPATVWLLGMAFAGFGFARRRLSA